jgi:heat shock protein HslJ
VQIDLLRNGILVLPNAPFSGSIQDCLNTAGSYTYRLTVLGSNGDTFAEDRGVTVTAGSSNLPLQGTTWYLESYLEGTATSAILPGTAVTAIFGADGQLSGSGGCNNYSANYTADAGSIFILPPVGNQLICPNPPGIMEQEAAYLLALPMATSYEISSSTLTLQDANGRVVLQYTARRT